MIFFHLPRSFPLSPVFQLSGQIHCSGPIFHSIHPDFSFFEPKTGILNRIGFPSPRGEDVIFLDNYYYINNLWKYKFTFQFSGHHWERSPG
jgi:hypothetical protein